MSAGRIFFKEREAQKTDCQFRRSGCKIF
jgi:hypothetical protein